MGKIKYHEEIPDYYRQGLEGCIDKMKNLCPECDINIELRNYFRYRGMLVDLGIPKELLKPYDIRVREYL